jgi:dTDP-4-dehydrorhamnose reductase
MTQVIALTGYRGLLGSACDEILRMDGNTVIRLESDITDHNALIREISASGARAVIHTAAMTDVAQCEREPERAFAVNDKGTQNVVDAARLINARVIGISTTSVFFGEEGDYKESDIPHPTSNAYNMSKLNAEGHIRSYENGLILRLNLIGLHPSGSRGKNFLEFLYDSFSLNKDITVFEDVRINPLSNWTIATIITGIIHSGIQVPILHIGSCDVLSKADIADLVKFRFPEYTGAMQRGSVDAIADGVQRPKEMWLSTELFQSLSGIKLPTLAQEIETIFSHL